MLLLRVDTSETMDSRLDWPRLVVVVLVEYRAEEDEVSVEDQALRRLIGLGRMVRRGLAVRARNAGRESGTEAACDGAGLGVSVAAR
jgi:hypothetical protein